MFIDKIGFNPFESTENSCSSEGTNAIAAPAVKKTYSFVGSNDVDDVDTSNITFDEKEINNSLEKAGSNAENKNYQVKTTSGINNTKTSASAEKTDTQLSDIFSQIIAAQQKEEFDKANTLTAQYNNLLATRPETEVDTAKIAEIDKEIASLESELSSLSNTKYTQMKNEDEYGQYITEQKENEINSQLKELKLKKYNLERNGKVSAEELSIYFLYLDNEFRSTRLTEKRKYLKYKETQINTEKEKAIKNGDTTQQYILYQQENAIIALDKIFEMDENNINKRINETKSFIETLNTEPIKSTDNNNADKKALLETMQKQTELSYKTIQIASAKSTALQNEDEYQQYVLEQQENEINKQDKELEITKQKLIAKLNGKELSNTQIDILSDKLENEFRLCRIKEKRQYLSYKAIENASAESTAYQNEDEYQLYILEQQKNAINALDKIFEMDQNNIEQLINQQTNSLDILSLDNVKNLNDNDANKKEIESIENKLVEAAQKKAQLYSELSTAMQNEDTQKYNSILSEIEATNSSIIELKVNEAKVLATVNNKEFSSTEEENLKTKLNEEFTTEKSANEKKFAEYKEIQLATLETTQKQQESVGGTITIGQTTTKTVKEDETEPYTENDGTFAFKGKKLYRNGQKYTGEFEGKLYKKGKLFKGVTNGLRYKNGVKLTGKRLGKMYVKGELAQGEVDGKMYNKGKLLNGLATYTPYKEDGKTLDTQNAVTTYYKKGVKATGKYKGKLYVDGALFTGTYKKKTYVKGIRKK